MHLCMQLKWYSYLVILACIPCVLNVNTMHMIKFQSALSLVIQTTFSSFSHFSSLPNSHTLRRRSGLVFCPFLKIWGRTKFNFIWVGQKFSEKFHPRTKFFRNILSWDKNFYPKNFLKIFIQGHFLVGQKFLQKHQVLEHKWPSLLLQWLFADVV